MERRLGEAAEHFENERYGDAGRILKKLSDEAPTVAAVRELYGLNLYLQEKWTRAARELEAFRLLSNSTEQHPVLADCYRALRQWPQVEELWDELRAASPDAVLVTEGRIVMAGSLADRDRVVDAIRVLQTGWSFPKRPKLHHLRRAYALADLYERAGEVPRARGPLPADPGRGPRLRRRPGPAPQPALSGRPGPASEGCRTPFVAWPPLPPTIRAVAPCARPPSGGGPHVRDPSERHRTVPRRRHRSAAGHQPGRAARFAQPRPRAPGSPVGRRPGRLRRHRPDGSGRGEPARAESVPVAWFEPPSSASAMGAGDDVVVVGRVRRRFFRAGGATASRTEVVAAAVVPARAPARVRRAMAPLLTQLTGAG